MTICKKCGFTHGHFKNNRLRKTCPTKGGANPIYTALVKQPKSIKAMLAKHGSKQIKFIRYGREPIPRFMSWLFEKIGGRTLAEIKQKFNYDEIYHLYCVLYLEDGTLIRFEKNQRVQYNDKYRESDETNVY